MKDIDALLGRVRDADRPPPEARDRVRRTLVSSLAGSGALVFGTAATTTAAASAASAPVATVAAIAVKTSGIVLAANLTASVLVGGAVAAGVAASTVYATSPRHESTVVSATASARVSLRSPIASESPAPQPGAAGPAYDPIASDQPTPWATADTRLLAPAATEARVATPSASLAAEIRLLTEAQVELRSGRPQRSLELIEAHEGSFAGGALREERMATKVLVLCALSRNDDARVLAARFQSHFPQSPLLPRVQRSCVKRMPP